MEKFLSLTLTGAVSGAVYSLVASGLVVSYAASGIFDFGHGAIAFAAAFVYFELHTGMHWAIVPAASVTILLFSPLLGLALDRLIFRPLAGADDAPRIMTTVGLLVALPALCLWLLERSATVLHWNLPRIDTVFLPPGVGPAPPHNYTLIKGVNIDSDQMATFLAAGLASVLLWYVLRRTRLGLSMRATVDRPVLARIRGVDPGRSSAAAWVLGVVLAGLAGVVASPIFNSLAPGTYNLILFVAATAAVLGGLRSIPVAFVGGLALGVAQNLVAGYATFASSIQGFNSAVPFALLLVGLLALRRPGGGVSAPSADAATAPAPLAAPPSWRRWAPWTLAAGLLLLYV